MSNGLSLDALVDDVLGVVVALLDVSSRLFLAFTCRKFSTIVSLITNKRKLHRKLFTALGKSGSLDGVDWLAEHQWQIDFHSFAVGSLKAGHLLLFNSKRIKFQLTNDFHYDFTYNGEYNTSLNVARVNFLVGQSGSRQLLSKLSTVFKRGNERDFLLGGAAAGGNLDFFTHVFKLEAGSVDFRGLAFNMANKGHFHLLDWLLKEDLVTFDVAEKDSKKFIPAINVLGYWHDYQTVQIVKPKHQLATVKYLLALKVPMNNEAVVTTLIAGCAFSSYEFLETIHPDLSKYITHYNYLIDEMVWSELFKPDRALPMNIELIKFVARKSKAFFQGSWNSIWRSLIEEIIPSFSDPDGHSDRQGPADEETDPKHVDMVLKHVEELLEIGVQLPDDLSKEVIETLSTSAYLKRLRDILEKTKDVSPL